VLIVAGFVAVLAVLCGIIYFRLRQSGLLDDDSEARFAASMAATGALAAAGKLAAPPILTSPVRIAVPRSVKADLAGEVWAARLRERDLDEVSVAPADVPGAVVIAAGPLRLEVQRTARGRAAATPPAGLEGEELAAFLAAPMALMVARVQGSGSRRARVRFAAEVLLALLEDVESLGALEVQSGAYHPKRSLTTLLELGDADGLAERLGFGASVADDDVDARPI
jgi:hypothetical protein